MQRRARSVRADSRSLKLFGLKLLDEFQDFNERIPGIELNRGLRRALAKNRRVRPSFALCWLIPKPPTGAIRKKMYEVGTAKVRLYKLPGSAESLYHVEPSEYRLSKEKLRLIGRVIEKLGGEPPDDQRVFHPKKVKDYIDERSRSMIGRICEEEGLSLGRNRSSEQVSIGELSRIVVKYTIGFGLLEVLLEDRNVQDIYIDSPVDKNWVYLTMGFMDDKDLSSKFRTNIVITSQAAECLMSRFRYESGRPFSEAHPHLECDNEMFNTRVTIIGPPISPKGMAFALRRHSPEPWTLPRLIRAGSLSSEAAGLISFLLDGQSTMLIAGGRGAGKSSLLGAVMFEFSPAQRILTIEDTLELPGPEMQKLGYKLQRMHIQSSLSGKGPLTADSALRLSLRLGESAIVLGEVRGQEAKTLYEAMRAGTAGSAVLGTFHADSARAVFERVVYDMGISAEAFGSTDIVIIAGLRRPSGVHKYRRRVLQIAELSKNASQHGTFSDLMSYDTDSDELVSSDVLTCSSERLSVIARSWGTTYEEILENIKVRGRIKHELVDFARRRGRDDVLTASWVLSCNTMFWELLQRQHSTDGNLDYSRLLCDWKKWFAEAVKYGS